MALKDGLLVLLFALAAPLAAAAEKVPGWPMFLGNPAHDARPASDLAPPLEQLWEFDAGDLLYASPVVSSGKVF
ncbi:MAG TPA: hypothetical protein ENI99_11750, partial [Sedimenticola sp.]|nr:hypothetical protein [Sedimenticola sp.]